LGPLELGPVGRTWWVAWLQVMTVAATLLGV
jgi:hypothetical protein